MLSNKKIKENDNHWVSISDLMSVLMMIFLFIAITYIQSVQANQKKVKSIAVAYQQLQTELYLDLYEEFKNDFTKWNAEIDRRSMSIRFNEPNVLFEVGKAEVKPLFKMILAEFFPRYIKILYSDKYRDNIEEIRIEGHTSSEWSGVDDIFNRYFLNMGLSQGRTRSVLEYCIELIPDDARRRWIMENITANGLSFSKMVVNNTGLEDHEKSRRVEFRTRTNAEKRIVQIIETMEK